MYINGLMVNKNEILRFRDLKQWLSTAGHHYCQMLSSIKHGPGTN